MSLNEALATVGVVIMFFWIFGLIAYNVYKSPDDSRKDTYQQDKRSQVNDPAR